MAANLPTIPKNTAEINAKANQRSGETPCLVQSPPPPLLASNQLLAELPLKVRVLPGLRCAYGPVLVDGLRLGTYR